MKLRIFALLLALSAIGLSASGARADGIIISCPPPPPPCRECPPIPQPLPCPPINQALQIKFHRVEVRIEDQVARIEVDQVFFNPQAYPIEGIYLFPLPADATIHEFALFIDGQRVEGQVLDREAARRIYQEIVFRTRDPALLEYIDRGAFQASIFPIPPQAERRIQITYRQILSAEGGLVKYVYPLDTERFSALPLEEVVISVDLRSDQPIKSVYSPSHEVAIDRLDNVHVRVGFEAADVVPDEDFVLFYSFSPSDFEAQLLSYREPDEEGFFLLLVAPPFDAEEQEVVAKDVIFVIDTSGSMEGEKLQQAKEALRFVLSRLNPEDRFNIVSFSTGVEAYAPRLHPAEGWRVAEGFSRSLRALGGTNIHDALLMALDLVGDDERPKFLIFLTDGLPTEGIVDQGTILADVREAASEDIRLFTFGVGDDVNTVLLDSLAQENHGSSAYVRPEEDIEAEVSRFYARIQTPVLSDLSLEFQGAEVFDTYPEPLPDLFLDSQLLIVGRYSGGNATLVLRGEVNGRSESFTFEGLRFGGKGGPGFIPRLWATRKIGYLLNQIRLHGENPEVVKQIVALSLRYGVITPYTSFLVQEEGIDMFTQEGRDMAVERFLAEPEAPASGAAAVRDAETREALRQAERVAQTNPAVRQAGHKVFILKDGVWIETTYTEGVEVTKVGFASEDYFRLLAAHPEWGAYFALGPRVIVVLEDQAVEVTLEEQPPLEFPQPAEEPPSAESSNSPFQFLRDLWEWVWGYFAHHNGDGYGKSTGARQPSAFVLSLFPR